MARSRLEQFLPLSAAGYACTTGQLLDVLLAVSANKETIEQVCADLKIKVGAETIRGYFNQQLKVENLSDLQESVNLALMASLNADLKRQKLELAIEFHDQSYYGKAEQSEGLWVGAEARQRNDQSVSGSEFVCYQEWTSADARHQVRAAAGKGERSGRVFARAVERIRDRGADAVFGSRFRVN